jgi:hypothetical protein
VDRGQWSLAALHFEAMGVKRKQHPNVEDVEDESIQNRNRRKGSVKQSPLPTDSPPPLPDQPVPGEQPAPLPDEPLPDDAPPLPDEPPPLPDELAPTSSEASEDESFVENQDNSTPTEQNLKDAWQAIWEPSAQAYYFYNFETKETTWLNPRLPPDEAAASLAINPPHLAQPSSGPPEDIYDSETGKYGFTARFNLRTGKFQNNPEITAENFSTQGQLMRTAQEYFDVKQMQVGKVAGQSGGGLKADRKAMKIPKSAMKELIRRRKEKRDKNKREWLINDDIIVRKH